MQINEQAALDSLWAQLDARKSALVERVLAQLTSPNGVTERALVASRYSVFHERGGSLIDVFGFDNIVVNQGLDTLLNNTFFAAPSGVAWYVGLIGANDGTVAINSGATAITGSGTSFQATDVNSDITIAGAGPSGADFFTTIASRASTTSAATAANAGSTVSGALYAIEPRAADVMASKSFNETAPYSNATRPAWTPNSASSGGAMSNSSSRASFSINTTGRVFGAFMVGLNNKSGITGPLYGGGLFTAGSRSVLNGDTLNVQVDLSLVAS